MILTVLMLAFASNHEQPNACVNHTDSRRVNVSGTGNSGSGSAPSQQTKIQNDTGAVRSFINSGGLNPSKPLR